MQRNDVRVDVGDIAAGKEKGDTLNTIDSLHPLRELLAEGADPQEECGRQHLEGRNVIARNDLCMPRPDRAPIKERDDVLVLVQGNSASRICGDIAEGTGRCHFLFCTSHRMYDIRSPREEACV